MEVVHDEFIDDSMYSVGWKEVSTGNACSLKDCKCNGSGSCIYLIFNHFMYKDDCIDDVYMVDQFDFLINVVNGTKDELSVEEIRCRQYTVGAAYRYYTKMVVADTLRQTMVSMFVGDYKSTCFNMSCFMLETDRNEEMSDCLQFRHPRNGMLSILCKGEGATASILEAICLLGVDPIVLPEVDCCLDMVDSKGRTQSINVCSSGFSNKSVSTINILGSLDRPADYFVQRENVLGVKAVRTATVTVSVILTPKSLYGGKNPTTKLVSYYVHNVKV